MSSRSTHCVSWRRGLPALAIFATGVASSAPGDTMAVPPGGQQLAYSGDGRIVAFVSSDATLVPGDTNNVEDVFVKDLQSGIVQRVSVNSQGVQGHAQSYAPALSYDGRFVAFRSLANNLVAGDRNGKLDIFVRDRLLGRTERVSINSAGAEGRGNADYPVISGDGRFVAFRYVGALLEPGVNSTDVLLRDRKTAKTELISVDENGERLDVGSSGMPEVSISADGRYVVFHTSGAGAAHLDSVFLRDRLTGQVERETRDAGGAVFVVNAHRPVISANGRYVAFFAYDGVSQYNLFVRDRQTGVFQTASVDQGGSPVGINLTGYSLSGSGRFVSFASAASTIVSDDDNGVVDVFARDMLMGITERVSIASNGDEGDDLSRNGSISSDGKRVLIESSASNLVPAPHPATNVYLRETTLPAAALSVGPLSLGFFGQTVNTVSPAQTFRITNSTSAAAAITGIAFAGPNTGQFARTDNCPASLTAASYCTVSVTFKPTSLGVKTASLNVNGGGAGLRSVVLSGKGTAPAP